MIHAKNCKKFLKLSKLRPKYYRSFFFGYRVSAVSDVRLTLRLVVTCSRISKKPFLPRDAMQAQPMPSCGVRLYVCLSVCRSSVTFMNYVETNKDICRIFNCRVATLFYILGFLH